MESYLWNKLTLIIKLHEVINQHTEGGKFTNTAWTRPFLKLTYTFNAEQKRLHWHLWTLDIVHTVNRMFNCCELTRLLEFFRRTNAVKTSEQGIEKLPLPQYISNKSPELFCYVMPCQHFFHRCLAIRLSEAVFLPAGMKLLDHDTVKVHDKNHGM